MQRTKMFRLLLLHQVHQDKSEVEAQVVVIGVIVETAVNDVVALLASHAVSTTPSYSTSVA